MVYIGLLSTYRQLQASCFAEALSINDLFSLGDGMLLQVKLTGHKSNKHNPDCFCPRQRVLSHKAQYQHHV